ncbi:MAG: hypothetical protein EOM69_04290 [Clostridia bacterium]|nr:hypothetical protein [Clostridia bacterium]
MHLITKRKLILWIVVYTLALLLAVWLIVHLSLLSLESAKSQGAVAVFSQDNLFAVDTPAPTQTALPASAAPASSALPASASHASASPATETPAPPSVAPDGGFRIEVIGRESVPPLAQKRILIYHTHTYEAYEQAEKKYQETQKWRTTDPEYNMVRVGEELTALLTGLGFSVTHDPGAYEPPELSSAYTRSLAMLEKRIAEGESYDLYIDLHRDAYSQGVKGDNYVTVGDIRVAKLMMLIGKGEGATGEGFGEKPEWEKNLVIAQAITDSLNEQKKGLCRDVRLKTGRFNQHIAPCCVLIEVGNNKNTLQEALAAMPYLADAIAQCLR